MALITEEIQVPASTRLRTKALKCDLCGKQSPTDSWGKDSYDVNEVTIEHKVGYSYPDSHDTKTTCVDLCPACFKTRLLPWLKEQGAALGPQPAGYRVVEAVTDNLAAASTTAAQRLHK